MGFREIRTRERITDEDERRRRENEKWRQIKPENKMSMEEMDAFWRAEFDRIAREAAAESQEG